MNTPQNLEEEEHVDELFLLVVDSLGGIEKYPEQASV